MSDLTVALARTREGELRTITRRPEHLMSHELRLETRTPRRPWRRRAG